MSQRRAKREVLSDEIVLTIIRAASRNRILEGELHSVRDPDAD